MTNTEEIIDALRQIASRTNDLPLEERSNPLAPSTWRGGRLRLEQGLSETELARAEAAYNFRFPPDWREVLGEVIPLDAIGEERQSFPNWHDVSNNYIQGMMEWPFEMLLFDVEHNRDRLSDWPVQPQSGEDLPAMTRATLEKAPRLIPIFAHRFLPATPCESGNPVFSMHGTDTIIYGNDLLSYFRHEFGLTNPRGEEPPLKNIPFWSDLA